MSKEVVSSRCSLVDAHCHIDLQKNPGADVSEAETKRVHTIAVTNAPSVFFHTRDLCKGKAFVHAALGLHPELIGSHGHEIGKFTEHISETTFIGEVGLDYVTSDLTLRKKQRDALSSIVQQSSAAGGRVMTVHSRRAATDTIEILAAGVGNSVILHWFSGSLKELRRGLDFGFFFSVNAAMLSAKSGAAILEALPRESVLTETDAPFARVAGRPSTPRDIAEATKLLASLWNSTEEETACIVHSNFKRILLTHGLSD